jgi:hypothetical protein
VPGGDNNAYDYAGQNPSANYDFSGDSYREYNDGWQCGPAGCLHLTRSCDSHRGYCALFWALKLTGEARAGYSVTFEFEIFVNSTSVSDRHEYGHPEEGSYYWHGSWGVHSGDDRGRYRYDLVLHSHVKRHTRVTLEMAGTVVLYGGKTAYIYAYGSWT